MQFNDAWQQLVAKQTLLADPKAVVEIKSMNLHSLLRQFYEQEQKHPAQPSKSAADVPIPDFMKTLFRGM